MSGSFAGMSPAPLKPELTRRPNRTPKGRRRGRRERTPFFSKSAWDPCKGAAAQQASRSSSTSRNSSALDCRQRARPQQGMLKKPSLKAPHFFPFLQHLQHPLARSHSISHRTLRRATAAQGKMWETMIVQDPLSCTHSDRQIEKAQTSAATGKQWSSRCRWWWDQPHKPFCSRFRNNQPFFALRSYPSIGSTCLTWTAERRPNLAFTHVPLPLAVFETKSTPPHSFSSSWGLPITPPPCPRRAPLPPPCAPAPCLPPAPGSPPPPPAPPH